MKMRRSEMALGSGAIGRYPFRNHPYKEDLMSQLRPLVRSLVVAALFSLASASAARAETSCGLRGGFSSSPDQFLIGGQVNFSPVGENLYIVPSAEAGFGDNLFTLSFNGDLQYRFRVKRGSEVRPYAGGGLSLYYVNVDGGGSDTNMGVDVLGGIFFGRASGNPMFLEAKAGLTDEVPDWKFIFGINF